MWSVTYLLTSLNKHTVASKLYRCDLLHIYFYFKRIILLYSSILLQANFVDVVSYISTSISSAILLYSSTLLQANFTDVICYISTSVSCAILLYSCILLCNTEHFDTKVDRYNISALFTSISRAILLHSCILLQANFIDLICYIFTYSCTMLQANFIDVICSR